MPRPIPRAVLAALAIVGAACGRNAAGPSPRGGGSTIAAVAGDLQTTAPGTAVFVTPVVFVSDGNTPAPGVMVTFAVVAGGGTVEVASAQTDASGRATCGKWTLGPAAGVNVLEASIAGNDPVVFTAMALRATSGISVAMLAPKASSLVGDSIQVTATVRSAQELASVVASVEGTSTPLGYVVTRFGPVWQGSLQLAGHPRGPIAVMVTATDVLGHVGEEAVFVILDRPPSIAVTSPADEAVARPQISIAATCADDAPAGCSSMTARVASPPPATRIGSGTASLRETVDLSAWEGQAVELVISGVDSAGQRTDVTRVIYVESSPHLSLFATVGGRVWDALGSRLLYLDVSGAVPTLRISDLSAGTVETLDTGSGLTDSNGYLTSTGAIYTHGETVPTNYPYCWLYEWRNRASTRLTGLNSCISLSVSGDYAVYNAQNSPFPTPFTLLRRDLLTGVSTEISKQAGNWENGVAGNGAVAYWTEGSVFPAAGYNIHLWSGGIDTQLTADAATAFWNYYPLTDGKNVVYNKQSHSPGFVATHRITLKDGATETFLTPAMSSEPAPHANYEIAGGFVAYTVPAIDTSMQVWRRHGPGSEEKLSNFGSSSTIDALTPEGAVLFINGVEGRFLAVSGAPLERIGSSLGRSIYRGGKFRVLLGNSVLEVVP